MKNAKQLYTVTMCRSIPLRMEGETQVMKDTIETYFDYNDAQIKALQSKFPGTDVQVEKQTRELKRAPIVDFGERYLAIKRFPSVPREERVVKEKTFVPHTVTAKVGYVSPGYADLVNEMAKDAS